MGNSAFGVRALCCPEYRGEGELVCGRGWGRRDVRRTNRYPKDLSRLRSLKRPPRFDSWSGHEAAKGYEHGTV